MCIREAGPVGGEGDAEGGEEEQRSRPLGQGGAEHLPGEAREGARGYLQEAPGPDLANGVIVEWEDESLMKMKPLLKESSLDRLGQEENMRAWEKLGGSQGMLHGLRELRSYVVEDAGAKPAGVEEGGQPVTKPKKGHDQSYDGACGEPLEERAKKDHTRWHLIVCLVELESFQEEFGKIKHGFILKEFGGVVVVLGQLESDHVVPSEELNLIDEWWSAERMWKSREE